MTIFRTAMAGIISLCAVVLSGCAGNMTPTASIDYELFGSGAEKVVVLHDWLGDRSNYDPIKPYLDGETFQFAFADLRGYGGSLKKTGAFTATEAAMDAISVADALGWDRFHIIGHSMTGMVVQKVAVLAGERVKSVVATTPVYASGMQVDEGTFGFFTAAAKKPEEMGQAIQALTGGKLSEEWTSFKVDRAMTWSTEEARLAYLDMFAYEDFSGEVDGIGTPFLVLIGANDIEAFHPPAIQATFGKWYPDLTVVQVTDAGHYPMQEVPVLYATEVQKFLKAHLGD
ncbi:alpha/beta hydrolase [Rhodospirillaceae bacterium KN72]|uniref:Alpha/beta hydrolase n=1 Tax=Pacificispira spongiicola TaxID=2729598 RepID=A0A7Y0DXN9_9PROT|nr:alpha/beta hydrolase [Pacificispira spongiicola]NMM43514.1 alpha/beta hydrolase [Pacificispira spongiicola]